MSYFRSLMRTFVHSMLCAVLMCLAPVAAMADPSSASLTVTISDSSGAIVPGAKVKLLNSDTNQEQTLTSGKSGSVTFPFLKPGHYSLVISKQDFAEVNVSNIALNVGDQRQLPLVLRVGSAAQEVTVNGSGPTINTTDGSVSTIIDRKFVENIPLNGRSFQDLISMTPGILTQSPQNSGVTAGYSGDFSVNGQRTESNYYSVDGVSGNVGAGNGYGVPQPASAGGLPSSTALGTTQSLLSVDALQEFRVESSTYSAEFGRSPGGQFSFVTRSGTNDLHGSVFDFFRNDIFDANDWFSNHSSLAKPALRQNDFGGTLGGPIWLPKLYDGKNRSFFFLSYEGLRLTQPQVGTVQYVPDTYMRQQAPAALQPILNAWPIQTGTDYGTAANPSLAVFLKSYSLPSAIDSTSVRLDHAISPKLAIFFRANYTPSTTDLRALSVVTHQNVGTQMYTLGITTQLSSHLDNELRIGYGGSSSSRTSALDSFGGATPVDLIHAMTGATFGEYSEADPYIYIAGIGSAELATMKTKNGGAQWNIVDSSSLSIGKHQLKLGVDYLHVRSLLAPATPYISPYWPSASSIVSGQPYEIDLSKRASSTPLFSYWSVYAQDEWRLTPRISLSEGLRWEVDPPPTEAHGNDAYTLRGDPSIPASLTLAPKGTPLWQTTYFNLAPRLGVAWQVHNKRGKETVVRGGGGVFFDSDNWAATQGYSTFAIGFSQPSTVFGLLPISPTELNFPIAAQPPYNASAYAFPSHLQLPYTLEWNTSLEQSLGERQSLTISYVAANGRRMVGEQRFSFSPVQNANLSSVYFFRANQTSSYNSLQVKFQRTVIRGLQALGSYVWSHSIDYGSSATSLPTTRANSDFDVRHNFTAGLTWDIPSPSNVGMLGALARNWGADGRLIARTAFPLTLLGNLQTDSTGERYYAGVNFVPGKPYYLYSSALPGGRALNPGAFIVSAATTANGTVPRNLFRGFDETQLNLSLRRSFHLSEATIFQFHADAFNILNHPAFGSIDTNVTDAQFGQATAMLNHSLTTLSPQYQQGGPRSFQFSLKLQF